MARRIVSTTATGIYDALVRPTRFVMADHESLEQSLLGAVDQLGHLGAIFLTNLLAYAIPLTLAGLGTVPETLSTPTWFAALFAPTTVDVAGAWRFTLRFAQNCLYLTGATVATFAAFHAGVLVTRSSTGVLPSLHTVIYSTSAYLAGIFSFVMYLDTTPGVSTAAALVRWIQLRFVYGVLDAFGSDFVLAAWSRPGANPPVGLTTKEQVLLAGLVVAGSYYVYSLYLGSRINHRTDRTTAAMTVVMVLATPLLFVLGSLLAVTTL
ncbi:hypothetical protein ACFQJD_17265 [Haloplanus sp. GCM10025708]|uniref:hypothetical protein n=1 Tax=Haloferacaceae TaxID=1644056 RepID=UPI0036073A76